MPLTVGHLLQGRYHILELLGKGGMGAVYLAEDTHYGRHCAVKENLPDPYASKSLLAQAHKQFLAEANVLERLDHPNLPKISDHFREGSGDYLVMDYVEGEDLESAMQRISGPLPEKPVLIWADQVLNALTYLHSHHPRPIIHRDIKPANIRLTPQGKIKLVDFGLAKLLDPNNPRTMTVVRGRGTQEYAPQEQYAAKGTGHTDARSDIYSLGATLYHLLTNTPPPDVYQRLINPTALKSPRQLNPRLTGNTEQAILRAMEIQPDQRFQSADEMRQALLPQAEFPAVTHAHPSPMAETVAMPIAGAEQAPLPAVSPASPSPMAEMAVIPIVPAGQTPLPAVAPAPPSPVAETVAIPIPQAEQATLPAVPRLRCPHCGQMMIPAAETLCFRCGRPLAEATPSPLMAKATLVNDTLTGCSNDAAGGT